MTETIGEMVNKRVPSFPQLTNQERTVLKQLAEPGGPLWKIVRSAVDFADKVRDDLAECDLGTDEGLALARQLQAERKAAIGFAAWFVGVITMGPTHLNSETDHG